MRALLPLLLLAALVLAGCSAGTSDDPDTPPNADPLGSHTLPPVNQDTDTISGSPSPSNSTTSTTTAASGTTTYQAAQAKPFAAHDQEAGANDAEFPGLFLGGRLQGSGAQVTVEATANNVGERDYRVADGCGKPWTETMHGPGGQVVSHRQPAATCAGSTLKSFPAHEFLSTALSWDGQVWDSAKGTFTPAPPGAYTWEVAFEVHDATGDDHAVLMLSFDVTVP
jgi:hypothetical protein